MTTARKHDSTNFVQLFPFIAVLLCTMGALLVVLVAVAQNARESAEKRLLAEKTPNAAALAVDPAAVDRLRKLTEYLAQLQSKIAEAREFLRNDQLQLSHLEDHMRKLQLELDTLKLAAADLNSLEATHFDDREQAGRELARLRELIQERELAVEELRKAQSSRRTYAILPFKTPSGTRRPPVCFECNHDGVFLQPQGIPFTRDDFRGPAGPGSPIAAAFRAAREELMRNSPADPNQQLEPYALVVVRPGGQLTSVYVLKVFEASGIDFGYELMEPDAVVAYPPADPQVMAAQYQAIITARERLKMLASAAPRMYENAADFYATGNRESERFAEDEYDDSTAELVGAGDGGRMGMGGRGSEIAVDSTDRSPLGNAGRLAVAVREPQGTASTSARYAAAGAGPQLGAPGNSITPQELPLPARGGNLAGSDAENANNSSKSPGGSPHGAAAPQAPGGQMPPEGQPSNGQPSGSQSADGPALATAGAPGTGAGMAGSANTSTAPSSDSADAKYGEYDPHALPPNASKQRNFQSSVPATEDGAAASAQVDPFGRFDSDTYQPRRKGKIRGKDWAIRARNPGSMPIRRTIRVSVRGDFMAVLPEEAHDTSDGSEIPLVGRTTLAGEQIATAIEQRIDSWGMAGQGLYWRPVIEMTVGPDGHQRAADLVRMLRNSGIEVKSAKVAKKQEGGDSASR